jgi:hypothetical protein
MSAFVLLSAFLLVEAPVVVVTFSYGQRRKQQFVGVAVTPAMLFGCRRGASGVLKATRMLLLLATVRAARATERECTSRESMEELQKAAGNSPLFLRVDE